MLSLYARETKPLPLHPTPYNVDSYPHPQQCWACVSRKLRSSQHLFYSVGGSLQLTGESIQLVYICFTAADTWIFFLVVMLVSN